LLKENNHYLLKGERKMRSKNKIFVSAAIVIILIISSWTGVRAAEIEDSQDNATIELRTDVTEIKKDKKIPVQIFVTNGNKKVTALDVLVDYNKDVFYDLTQEDFKTDIDTELLTYEPNADPTEKYGIFDILAKEGNGITNGVIATIYLTPKVDVSPNGLKVKLLSLFDGEVGYEDGSYLDMSDKDITTWPSEEELDKLYLNTEVYKIGNNNINKYEEDDRYISRVEPLTTLSSFKSNLFTNGNIKVLKPDGTELEDAEDKYVGTGMTLVVTKDEGTDKEQKIKLKISVKGDVARSKQEGDTSDENLKCGDGQVTMIDINRVNLVCINKIDLEDEFKIAADMNESGSISIIDLLRINFIIIGVNR